MSSPFLELVGLKCLWNRIAKQNGWNLAFEMDGTRVVCSGTALSLLICKCVTYNKDTVIIRSHWMHIKDVTHKRQSQMNQTSILVEAGS